MYNDLHSAIKIYAMKFFFILMLTLKAAFSFGQNPKNTDSIQSPIYDTTSIEIKSTNSFYFCSKLYAIPRNCDTQDQSNCCSFSANISKSQKGLSNEQISCYDGTSFHWDIFDTYELAKQNFESLPTQWKKQMKKFNQEEIKFFVCGKEVPAYRLTCTTLQGHDFTKIIFCATINGENILGELSLHNKAKSSKELSQLFQQLVRF